MPTYGDNENVTFGAMEGPRAAQQPHRPAEPEHHVSGPAGVCICGDQSADDECPAHGHGPTTLTGAARVRDALVARQEATGQVPAGTGVIQAGADGAIGGLPGLPPLETSLRGEMPIDQGEAAPNIADFPIEEADPADLKGTVYRIGDQVAAMVRAAVMQHSMGERVGWEFVPVPHPDRQGNLSMGFQLFLSIPGLVLGTNINLTIIKEDIWDWNQDKMSRLIGEMLDQGFASRSGQIEQMRTMQAQSRAAGNGSGLIIPGR